MNAFFKAGICPVENVAGSARGEAEDALVMSLPGNLPGPEVPVERTQRGGIHRQFQAVFTGGERRFGMAPPLFAIQTFEAKCQIQRNFLERLYLPGAEEA